MKTKLHPIIPAIFVVCVLAQDSQPFDREYKKTAAWVAAGGRVPAAKQTVDVRTIKTVRLISDRGACREGEQMRLGAGVPLKEGMVKDLSELGIRDASGALPAVFEKRTVYPDGSLQWVWADFVGKLGKEYWATIRSGAAMLPQPGVQASAAGDEITVSNGLLELKWNKSFATPMSVSLISAGRIIPVGRGDGKGIYFVSAAGERYALGGKSSELDFKIESCNPLRAVLRLEGWYVSDKGDKSGRALMRYDVGWNEPFVRVTHRFVVTDENDRMTYREIGVQFPAPAAGGAVARFGVVGTRP
ncbi:MAG: hypothetical protein FJ388_26450, partial [Verrucomicrobia bacterium]|nr:hypothetical protein [Verrucomicrobiota bacterium]